MWCLKAPLTCHTMSHVCIGPMSVDASTSRATILYWSRPHPTHWSDRSIMPMDAKSQDDKGGRTHAKTEIPSLLLGMFFESILLMFLWDEAWRYFFSIVSIVCDNFTNWSCLSSLVVLRCDDLEWLFGKVARGFVALCGSGWWFWVGSLLEVCSQVCFAGEANIICC